MTTTGFVLLILAGLGAGLVGYLTGLASLVSYPALLAAGLTPVAANVSNTIGLIGMGTGAVAKATSMVMADGRRKLLWQTAVALVGGFTGAGLVLVTGEHAFAKIVPWLVILASVALLASPRLSQLRGGREVPPAVYWGALFLVCCYGGYFGAGAGTIYIAMSLIATSETFQRAVLLKSVLLGVSNVAATILFICAGPVNWPAAIALAIGCLIGGYAGPWIQRFIPDRVLRWVIGIGGFVLAAWLWLR